MNTNSLKNIYEKMPKCIKFLFSSVFVRLMVNNKNFVSAYNTLDEFEKLSVDEQDKRQFELLKETLVYAYNNVPFYKKKFDEADFVPMNMTSSEDINKIPIITKEDVIDAGESIYSTENISFYESLTGGSSGHAMKVLLDQKSIYTERAFVCHFLSKFGYDIKKTRTLALWGHQKDSDYYYSPLKNEIVISPFLFFNDESFKNVWKSIKSFNPNYIAGYPSAIYMLAKLIEEKGLKHKFDLVYCYAENCSDETRAYIEKVLKCKVVAYYGHTERAAFAEEHYSEGGYLFNKLYGYTEFIPTDVPGEYKIVCTGFISRKMPLIRYATDDIAVFTENGYVKILGHKASEVCLISKSGGKIFKGALTMHLDVFSKVKQYQFVQNEQGKVYLDLVPVQTLTADDINTIQKYLEKRCEGELDITIRIVERVQLTRRGKYNWAVVNISE